MKEYKFTFEEKLLGAIGAFQGFSKSVFADSMENAILKIYDTHEHISKLYFWDGKEYVKYISKGEKPERNI